MENLIVIPARGGSKGIPHKNIKLLNGLSNLCLLLEVYYRVFEIPDVQCVITYFFTVA